MSYQKITFTLCFLLTSVIILKAQVNNIARDHFVDSVKASISNEKVDSIRQLKLLQLSLSYIEDEPDSASKYAAQTITIAEKNQDIESIAWIEYMMGIMYYYNKADYPNALKWLMKSLQQYEILKDQENIATTNYIIGSIYFMESEYKNALAYFETAKKYSESLKDQSINVGISLAIAKLYSKINSPDSAKLYLNRYGNEVISSGDTSNEISAWNLYGNLFSNIKDTAIALGYYKRAFRESIKRENSYETSIAALGIAKLLENKDSSIYYAELSLKTAHEAQEGPWASLEPATFLYNYYDTMVDKDSAFKYLKIINKINDSLFGLEKTRLIQKISFDEADRQKQMRENNLKQQKERKNNLQIMAIGTLAFICACFLIFLFRRKKRSKPHRKTNAKIIEWGGTISLLLIFEFITFFLHPNIEAITHHTPVLVFLLLVLTAAVLVPIHDRIKKSLEKKFLYHMHSNNENNNAN